MILHVDRLAQDCGNSSALTMELPQSCFMPSDKLEKEKRWIYRKTSNIRRTLVGNMIVDNSDVVGAAPVGAAPTTSSFST